jgi:hypothetical protein
MLSINCIYYFCLLLIFHPEHIWTYQCLQCVTKVFNHLGTITNLPSPTEDDCNIVTTVHGCYIHINWLADGTSEVYYKTDLDLPYDSILTIIERQVTLDTGKYLTRRSVGYSCRSNRTACNTIDNLKRAIISITFPTNEQIEQFDPLIAPRKNFNGTFCSRISNMPNCLKSNLINCQQCISTVQFSKPLKIRSACRTKQVTRNSFIYRTIISLNMESQLERIIIGCQNRNVCNSMKNIKQMKRILTIKFDSKKFYRSTASTMESTILLLLMIVCTGLVRFIEQHFA